MKRWNVVKNKFKRMFDKRNVSFIAPFMSIRELESFGYKKTYHNKIEFNKTNVIIKLKEFSELGLQFSKQNDEMSTLVMYQAVEICCWILEKDIEMYKFDEPLGVALFHDISYEFGAINYEKK